MSSALENLIAQWVRGDDELSKRIRDIKSRTDFLADIFYDKYIPTSASADRMFRRRLEQWLDSVSMDDYKRNLYLLLEYIHYLSEGDYKVLMRSAYSSAVLRWINEVEDIDLLEQSSRRDLKIAIDETLFTAVTDSFDLSRFLKINQIQNATVRFVWQQAKASGAFDPADFVQNILQKKRRVVLFEDFVSTGTQARWALDCVRQLGRDIEILFCPLVICPAGDTEAKRIVKSDPHFSYIPLLVIPEDDFVTCGDTPNPRHPAGQLACDLANDTNHLIHNGHPWGYKKTGALIVKYDNTPDNTLPLIHTSNRTWNPLFKRISRGD